jgi:hypothetical protein
MDQEILPVLPYSRPGQKKAILKRKNMLMMNTMTAIFVRKDRCFIIVQPTRDGYKQYASDPKQCQDCPFLSICTQSQNHMKLIHRHVWEGYLEEADHLRHTPQNKEIYAKRKETIERVFADAKEKHGMRWTTLRGLGKLSMQAMLTFAAINLKKMASWAWKTPRSA